MKGRTRGSRLSTVSSILMILLGVFALVRVSVILGVVLLLLGLGMYLFDRKIRGLHRAAGATDSERSEKPPAS